MGIWSAAVVGGAGGGRRPKKSDTLKVFFPPLLDAIGSWSRFARDATSIRGIPHGEVLQIRVRRTTASSKYSNAPPDTPRKTNIQKNSKKIIFQFAYFNSMAEKTLTYLLLGDGAFAFLRNAVLIES